MDQTEQIVVSLVLLQVLVAAYLWTLDALSEVSEGKFAIFLAVDLLSFATVAYVYRKQRWREYASPIWIVAGSLGLAVLILLSLFFP